jgi:hypothetical protein
VLSEWCRKCTKTLSRSRREADPDAHRAALKQWRQANAGYVNAKVRARLEHVRRATPPWADHDAIDSLYALAKAYEPVLGVKLHVDHEIPLRGKLVSGLHVEANLRVIPASENIRKNNRFNIHPTGTHHG